ncbi:MAG: hypothetical protein COB51_02305, partial [Moraxellaceae bacterium]
NNDLRVNEIDFSGIDSVVAGGGTDSVVGTSSGEVFSLLDTDNGLAVKGINFSGVDVVIAGIGDDSIVGTDAGENYALTGNNNGLAVKGISFSGVDAITGGNGLNQITGTTGDDGFQLLGNKSLNTNDINFVGVASVDGNGGDDLVVATSGDDVIQLIGTNAFEVEDIDFNNIGSVTGNGGKDTLIGTDSADQFALNGANAVTVLDIAFTGIDVVDGSGGADTTTADTVGRGVTFILGSNGSGIAEGMTLASMDGGYFGGEFNDVFNIGAEYSDGLVDGGAGDDQFNVAASNENVTVIGGSGEDTLTIVGDSLDWNINGDTAFDSSVTETGSGGLVVFNTIENLESDASQWSLSSAQAIALNSSTVEIGAVTLNYSANPQSVTLDVGSVVVNGFDSEEGDLTIVSSGSVVGAIDGTVIADTLDIESAAEVDLRTEINTLVVDAGGDVTIDQHGDLFIQSVVATDQDVAIEAEGNVTVGSVDTGFTGSVYLSAYGVDEFGTPNDLIAGDPTLSFAGINLHIRSENVTLQSQGNVGTDDAFSIYVTDALFIESLLFIDPNVFGDPSTVENIGDKIFSRTSQIVSSGVIAAVRPLGDELVVIDPALFTELRSYDVANNALNDVNMDSAFAARKVLEREDDAKRLEEERRLAAIAERKRLKRLASKKAEDERQAEIERKKARARWLAKLEKEKTQKEQLTLLNMARAAQEARALNVAATMAGNGLAAASVGAAGVAGVAGAGDVDVSGVGGAAFVGGNVIADSGGLGSHLEIARNNMAQREFASRADSSNAARFSTPPSGGVSPGTMPLEAMLSESVLSEAVLSEAVLSESVLSESVVQETESLEALSPEIESLKSRPSESKPSDSQSVASSGNSESDSEKNKHATEEDDAGELFERLIKVIVRSVREAISDLFV